MQNLVILYVEFEPSMQPVPRLTHEGGVVRDADGIPIKDLQPVLNKLGKMVSYEPAKWEAILQGRVKYPELEDAKGALTELLRHIQKCWQAGPDHPTSFNMLAEMNRKDFPHIRGLILRHFVGSIKVGIVDDVNVVFEPTGVKVLKFWRRAA